MPDSTPDLAHAGERPLSAREQRVVAKILSAAAGADALVARLPVARIVSGPITFLDLVVPADAPRADLPDGLLPISAHVLDADGAYTGEFLVWIEGGRLSALEYGWVTDDPPTEWPEPERVWIADQGGSRPRSSSRFARRFPRGTEQA